MTESAMLRQILDWKTFERLCADLLAAEGFTIESEPSIDTTGTDFTAHETYRSHDPGRTITLRWRVQCKHYVSSGRNLGREQVEAAIYAYEARRRADEGLFLIVSSDYTEAAKSVVDAYVESHSHARVTLWNGRHVIAKLERHPELVRRYGLPMSAPVPTDILESLRPFAGTTVLFVSDQSSLAHDLSRELRRLGFDLVILPVWNYALPEKLIVFLHGLRDVRFRLVVLFLGDTFAIQLPQALIDWIVREHSKGAALLFFPFLAWSLKRVGAYRELEELCPARLIDPQECAALNPLHSRLLGEHRKGDFSWLLEFDSFAEDRFAEYDPASADVTFAAGIPDRFGISHSFEFLEARADAQLAWADTSGNPVLITSAISGTRIAYVNSCCHACLSTVAVLSPLNASWQFGVFISNVFKWLLQPPP